MKSTLTGWAVRLSHTKVISTSVSGIVSEINSQRLAGTDVGLESTLYLSFMLAPTPFRLEGRGGGGGGALCLVIISLLFVEDPATMHHHLNKFLSGNQLAPAGLVETNQLFHKTTVHPLPSWCDPFDPQIQLQKGMSIEYVIYIRQDE